MMNQWYHSAGILGSELAKVRSLTLVQDGKAVLMVWLA